MTWGIVFSLAFRKKIMPIDLWKALIRHWSKMLMGQSYWHAAQGLGPCFQPGQLQDYYRNYSTKVEWNGDVDQSHFPLVQEPGGRPFHDPLTLAQKALGHWSCWLSSMRREERHCEAFLQLAGWFVRTQETQGSWQLPSMRKAIYIAPYSALAQGQAISVLVRAFSITSDEGYLETARRGLNFMLKPVQEGGTCRTTQEGPILEEYPRHQANTVLNGWVSALFGMYDVLLVVEQGDARDALEASLEALIKFLPRYDAGYWSFYDSLGSLASPYYHNVHITQLRALELTFPHYSNPLKAVRVRFEKQRSSSVCCTKAFVVKAFQKLKQPPVTLLIQSKAG